MRSSFLVTLITLAAGALVSAAPHIPPPSNHLARSSNPSPSNDDITARSSGPDAKKVTKFNKANGGPPVELFKANETLNIAKLKAAAKKLHTVVDTYPVNNGRKAHRTDIFGDWSKFKQGSAYVYTADMDIDCDGLNFECPGNEDGQPQTNFGALSAFAVPYVVIPDRFASHRAKELAGNNVVGVLCNGQLLYGIFGDTDGDSPQVIGEASWSMGRACFPKEGLNGGKGHGAVDVTYIFFTGKNAVYPNEFLGKNFLTDFPHLQKMGDGLVANLLKNLEPSS